MTAIDAHLLQLTAMSRGSDASECMCIYVVYVQYVRRRLRVLSHHWGWRRPGIIKGNVHGNSSFTSGVSSSTALITKSTSAVCITTGIACCLSLRGDLGNDAVVCWEGRFPDGGTGPFCGDGDRRF